MQKFDFDDILIEPAIITDIETRSIINVYNEDSYLPLITAPMDTVINSNNEALFESEFIKPCLPRGEKSKFGFESYSLIEINNMLDNGMPLPREVLIDVANGHMKSMVDTTSNIKKKYGDIVTVMVGNVAHPETYKILSDAGADYIRIGIGNGGGCLTTQQTGIGYPMASLVRECYEISCTLDSPAKIVADGGMKKYSDVIKALALGADCVMMGSIFNIAVESAGINVYYGTFGDSTELTPEEASEHFAAGRKVYKSFRGMSSKSVQRAWDKSEIKTSEGIETTREVEYTLGGWIENFKHYLKSAMSYTNSKTLDDFIGKVKYNVISDNALNRFKK